MAKKDKLMGYKAAWSHMFGKGMHGIKEEGSRYVIVSIAVFAADKGVIYSLWNNGEGGYDVRYKNCGRGWSKLGEYDEWRRQFEFMGKCFRKYEAKK